MWRQQAWSSTARYFFLYETFRLGPERPGPNRLGAETTWIQTLLHTNAVFSKGSADALFVRRGHCYIYMSFFKGRLLLHTDAVFCKGRSLLQRDVVFWKKRRPYCYQQMFFLLFFFVFCFFCSWFFFGFFCVRGDHVVFVRRDHCYICYIQMPSSVRGEVIATYRRRLCKGSMKNYFTQYRPKKDKDEISRITVLRSLNKFALFNVCQKNIKSRS